MMLTNTQENVASGHVNENQIEALMTKEEKPERTKLVDQVAKFQENPAPLVSRSYSSTQQAARAVLARLASGVLKVVRILCLLYFIYSLFSVVLMLWLMRAVSVYSLMNCPCGAIPFTWDLMVVNLGCLYISYKADIRSNVSWWRELHWIAEWSLGLAFPFLLKHFFNLQRSLKAAMDQGALEPVRNTTIQRIVDEENEIHVQFYRIMCFQLNLGYGTNVADKCELM